MAHIFTPALRRPLSKPFAKSGTRTLIQRAIASLRARGSDAHLWLPGVGTLSGLTTGNYLESTGNTLGTVDNPTGLVLDALGSVGVEKLSNIGGPFTNTTGFMAGNSAALSVVNGAMRVQQNGANYPTAGINFTTVAGSVYKVSFRVVKGTSASGVAIRVFNLSIGLGGAQIADSLYKTADGEYTVFFTAVSTSSSIYAIVNTTVLGAYDDIASISVREVSGIHLTQATTANKPILQKTDSKYSWAFDGSNDSLASATFAAGTLTSSMDCYVVVNRATTGNQLLLAGDNFKFFGAMGVALDNQSVGGGGLTARYLVDNTLVGVNPTFAALGTAVTVGVTHIVEMQGVDMSTLTLIGISNFAGWAINGAVFEVILTTAMSDADRTLIRSYLASKHGVTL